MAIEIFDKEKKSVVAILEIEPNDEKAIRDYLAPHGLTLSNGKIVDMAYLPFQATSYIIRQKKEWMKRE